MKKILGFIMMAGVALGLVACKTTDAKDPERIGMANPASVFCIESGGISSTVETADGQAGVCTLPTGEAIDEWEHYRNNHQ